MAEPSPRRSADPMHVQDRRFWLAILWAGSIGGALAVGCFIAWASGQMPLGWAALGVAIGLLAMAGATIYAFEKRPRKPSWRPGSILIAIAAFTWALIGWQTWLWLHSPVQGYTQVQLDKAVQEARASQPAPTITGFTQQQVDEKIAAALNAERQKNAPQPFNLSGIPRAADPYPPGAIIEKPFLSPEEALALYRSVYATNELVLNSQPDLNKFPLELLRPSRIGSSGPLNWQDAIIKQGFDKTIAQLNDIASKAKRHAMELESIYSEVPKSNFRDFGRIIGHVPFTDLQRAAEAYANDVEFLKRIAVPAEDMPRLVYKVLNDDVSRIAQAYSDLSQWHASFVNERAPAAFKALESFANGAKR